MVLKKRSACPLPDSNCFNKPRQGLATDLEREEEAYEETKKKGIASGGYLIGRHPECGMLLAHLNDT